MSAMESLPLLKAEDPVVTESIEDYLYSLVQGSACHMIHGFIAF